jgi:methylmalonyl-CoA/ethylmalonyl-CoA epimerase
MDRRLLDEDAIIQICFVTSQLEKTAAWLSDLIGMEPGPVRTLRPDQDHAIYKGSHSKFGCRIQFFEFGNIQLELLEPGPEKSAWRDVLEEKGPGFHHFAFKTRNLTTRSAYLEAKGHSLIQCGNFDAGGGRYAYFDTMAQLGALTELLEFDEDMEQQP